MSDPAVLSHTSPYPWLPVAFINKAPVEKAKSLSPSRRGGRGGPPPARVRNFAVPRDACQNYWESGECSRGWDCKFRHVKSTDTQHIAAPSTSTSAVLDQEKLENVSGPFTDAFSGASFSPTEAHNYMRPFLSPDYRFSNPNDIYLFVAILTSANSKNESWFLADGQDFLAMVGDPGGNCILRIQDVLRYEPVSPAPGSDWAALSFQRGYVPLLAYLGSEYVTRSTLQRNVNALYGLLDENFDAFERTITSSIESIMSSKTFTETGQPPMSGLHVFRTITTALYEYAIRFKKSVAIHPTFIDLTRNIVRWHEIWAKHICSSSHSQFDDPIAKWDLTAKAFVIDRLRKSINSLLEAVERAEGGTTRRSREDGVTQTDPLSADRGLINTLGMTFEGPGLLKVNGPRHDNDFEDISAIKVVPTDAELRCKDDPFLPANIPGAPHHHPAESMERLLDIQFRLLREELIAPIRSSLGHIMDDFEQPPNVTTQLDRLVRQKGGLYKAARGQSDSVTFSVYTSVIFAQIACDTRRGVSVSMSFDAPAGRAQDAAAAKRKAYWEGVGRKRLIQGGLIGLVWKPSGSDDAHIYLGVITSSLDDLMKSAKDSRYRLSIKVSFFETDVELRILRSLHKGDRSSQDTRFLIEAPIMFESIRPFLETLKLREPSAVPFARYIVHPAQGTLTGMAIDPPAYVTPNFQFDLSCLFDQPTQLFLKPYEPHSIDVARETLKESSRLDPSQADAMVDALVSEVSLMQGPPGTGKSYTGIEMLRTLVKNRVTPILLIAFTNHALDNIITHVLKKGITTKIIRLGGRSADPKIAEYSLQNIMSTRQKSRADKSGARAYAQAKEVEKLMEALMSKITNQTVNETTLRYNLTVDFSSHLDEISTPPHWISALFEDSKGWEQVGSVPQAKTLLEFWVQGGDIKFLTRPAPDPKTDQRKTSKKKKNTRYEVPAEVSEDQPDQWMEEVTAFFRSLNLQGVPTVPTTDRPLSELIDDSELWKMSLDERQRLYSHWIERIRESAYANQAQEFERLKVRHEQARTTLTEVNQKGELEVLMNAELIGCTTNGAAKLTNLLKNVRPKVLLVEEAGQVLEAHVLATLVPSIQHLILIGDPLQLRPTIENYQLSMDNPRTGRIYKFDQSLMERLSSTGLHMSRLDVQRRMRPTIAELVRSTLYPTLKDHELVQKYPPIRGMAKDVFFLDHRHAEDGAGEDSVSRTNSYEVRMIKDLVMYFLKQGKYTKTGDIIVLCAYLGQLVKLRKALSTEVATVIDERDADNLIDHEDNDDVADILGDVAEQVQVSNRVLLRTVDNFQGEEGTIVILSLVRNSGPDVAGKGIGFLRSNNRTNVALSRAREGMYILGNAEDLASRTPMWHKVVEGLRQNDQIGPAFPLACSRHPETIMEISLPGQIPLHAPDGGCLEPCGAQLRCGHLCPLKCHPDDEGHRRVKCIAECPKLCSRSHPCDKGCSVPCGQCRFPVAKQLACGHINQVQCCELDEPTKKKCITLVLKQLLSCEHSAEVPCSADPALSGCRAACGEIMECCGKRCTSQCKQCQLINDDVDGEGVIPRVKHGDHRCGKDLRCGHNCQGKCTDNHDCSETVCEADCRQHCSHRSCALRCSDPCAPCMEPCIWMCDHNGKACPVVCGAPCARLPCDVRCSTILNCGHRCPSVCGEPCARQICPLCPPNKAKEQVVDLVMGTTLNEIDPHAEDIDELLITLGCRHVFTVETLDGICELSQYYDRDGSTWTGLRPPPSGLQKPPVCPLCRGPIDCLRYGRVFKRADLDQSELNVANSCRRVLGGANKSIVAYDMTKATADLVALVANLDPTVLPGAAPGAGAGPETQTAVGKRKFGVSKSPVQSSDFGMTARRFTKLHRVPDAIASGWHTTVKDLLVAYENASQVAKTTSAHVRAHDAAISTLYHQFLGEIEHPESLPAHVTPEALALDTARRHSGLSAPPKADQRFRVEAFWVTFTIRFHLIELAQSVLERLEARPEARTLRSRWSDVMDYIFDSIDRDANIAIEIAQGSQSHRQVIRTVLFHMEAHYRAFAHRIAQHASGPLLETLKIEAREGLATAKQTVVNQSRAYRQAMPSLAEQRWVAESFVEPAEGIVAKWVDLIERLNRGVFYSEVSLQEKQDILKAFTSGFLGFSTRGHFYQCPNGHAYVITECGGAMETATCNECGVPIGGANHTLDSTNRPAMEFENLARGAGLGANPFPWGAGV